MVNTTSAGTDVRSTIVGQYNNGIYGVTYRIKTNRNWETLFCRVHTQHANYRDTILLESDGKGNWLENGKQESNFNGCIDVDIAVTPFTNTLPINRLKLKAGSEQQIQVIYLNVLERQTKPVLQKYRRLSKTAFQYQNIPNDFEATIEIDEEGFVVDYPSLFVRTAKLKSSYR